MIKITVHETQRETRFLTDAETLLWNIGKKAKNDDNYQIIAKIDSYFDKLRITDTPVDHITENGKTQIRVEFESIIERPATHKEYEAFLKMAACEHKLALHDYQNEDEYNKIYEDINHWNNVLSGKKLDFEMVEE